VGAVGDLNFEMELGAMKKQCDWEHLKWRFVSKLTGSREIQTPPKRASILLASKFIYIYAFIYLIIVIHMANMKVCYV